MLKKAHHFIRLISLVLFMVLSSYFESKAVTYVSSEEEQAYAATVSSCADPELKAILEPAVEIGNVNTSGRIISGIKKDGGVFFYELSSIKGNVLLTGESIFCAVHHIPLYISFRSILI